MEVAEDVLERFRATSDGAILGQDFLTEYRSKYPWRIGETYQLAELGGVSITFVGAFKSDNSVYNSVILADRRYLQEVDESLGRVHQVYIKIENPIDAKAIIASLDEKIAEEFPYETTTVDQRAALTAALEELAEIVEFSRLIMAITLAVILAAVANTISMATRDRMQEVGTLRALGFRRGHILWMIQGESVLLALAGGLLGVLAVFGFLDLGPYLGQREVDYGVRGVNLRFELGLGVALAALGLSLVVGLVGGILPALGASRVEIVHALRRME